MLSLFEATIPRIVEERAIELTWTTEVVVKPPTVPAAPEAKIVEAPPSTIEARPNTWTDFYLLEIEVKVPREMELEFHVKLLEGEKIRVRYGNTTVEIAEGEEKMIFTDRFKTGTHYVRLYVSYYVPDRGVSYRGKVIIYY